MIIKTYSYPRGALVGNPSDGYFGKTIAFVFSNFRAEVELSESEKLKIIPGERDHLVFHSIKELHDDITQFGYYGGVRLLKAAIKKFSDYSTENKIAIPHKNFTISYMSNIPNRLGLAGSSAIVTACFKALQQFYKIEIPKPILANLILAVEKDELGIGAGLQDRVAQVYETPVYMDFNKEAMQEKGYGIYIPIDKALLPSLFIAYRTNLSEGSETVHNKLRERYEANDQEVKKAISGWVDLTDQVKKKLESGDKNIGELMNRNFDIRKKIMPISKENLKMVDLARSVGASAKFTGSGGAIIGTYKDETMFNKLCKVMKENEIEVIKPDIVG